MGEGESITSLFSSVQQLVFDWSVICLVLLSMTIQVILVLVGASRYCTASRLLKLMVWVCYMGADFVATSALGAMIHYSSGEIIYAIWACMMMIHLGGPDAITAYSVPDNNLWKRHCFNMFYQGSIAAYVVYVSAVEDRVDEEWHLLVAAALIFLVGITKYGERAWALRLASPSQIVSSVKPIYNYMKIEHALGLDVDEGISDNEIADVDKFTKHENGITYNFADYQYIVAGEESFDEDNNNGDWSESIVTIKDVWEHEGEVVTDNYILCVSHALFKMYKRRFVSLRFHETALQKAETFFTLLRDSKKDQVLKILEIELKFVYDYLFTKSSGTAFSGWGVGMRIVNISLLGLCWLLIMLGLEETQHVLQGQRTITFILMCVAFGLEGFQLGRIILSDWSMVWLICATIRQTQSQRWWSNCIAKLMQGVAKVVGRVRKVLRGDYWQNQIPQLCVIDTCLSAGSYSYPLISSVLRFLPFKKFITALYIGEVTAWHIKRVFGDYRSKSLFYPDISSVTVDPRTHLFDVKLLLEEGIEEKGVGWEHLILGMHLATAICEESNRVKRVGDETSYRVKIVDDEAIRLSRYFAYLLVTCPEILAVEPENAKELYREVFLEITGKVRENGTLVQFYNNFIDPEWKETGSVPLRIAKGLVDECLKKPTQKGCKDYWNKKWSDTLYLSGVYDKSAVHAERLTVGGEYLTQLWVLWGHTGRAERSYDPTAMQMDPKQL